MSLLDELPDAPVDRQPWRRWALARWELYRADQIEGLKRAKAAGQPTDILEACIRMADYHIKRHVLRDTPVGDLQVVRDVQDLDGADG